MVCGDMDFIMQVLSSELSLELSFGWSSKEPLLLALLLQELAFSGWYLTTPLIFL